MKISVIIPTYNRTNELEDCINSIIKQQVLSTEILIIDNSSLDLKRNIESLVRKIQSITKVRLKYISEANKGASFCRNTGIRNANGDILAFIDDDCIADKNWIKVITESAGKYKNSILVGKNYYGKTYSIFSLTQYYRSKRIFLDTLFNKRGITYCQFIDTKNFAIPKTLIKKNNLFFDSHSGFSKYSACEDLDFSLRAGKNNIPIIYCDNMIVVHKEISNIYKYLSREFEKGRAFYHFKMKWPYYRLLKSKKRFLKELVADKKFRSNNLTGRILILLLFFIVGVTYKFGFKFERIFYLLSHSKYTSSYQR